ncbi:S41 family peptidase [Luteimonas composti]|uniref:S41 family peptidase n=1 Tax=Luteimonas composti TaxID=398257 RepID=A0ABT6MNP4_9GAMM|nr:S41 family peptidase [Luteimonas composti]MDH7452206.1 S41 family peptidase [Luteimonas composti]
MLLSRLLAVLGALALASCASPPFERPHEYEQPPAAVRPADGSAERAALNGRVHDAVVRYAQQLFYRRDADRAGFAAAAAALRPDSVAAVDEAALYAGIDRLLQTLDDAHTYALSPTARARRAAQRHGRADANWGLATVKDGPRTVVAAVDPAGPAAAAGVLAGWQLDTVDGQPPASAPAPVAGRSAHLVFVDEDGGRHGLDLVARAMEPPPRRERRQLRDGIAYLRFDDFDHVSEAWLVPELEALARTPPRALVLDLRRNGGGQWGVAARIHARLNPPREDLLVLHEGTAGHRILASTPRDPYTGPLAVLIGPGSASAAELLAARLQETGRARLFGQRSHGAVVGTRGINLPDGGLLRVGMWAITTAGGRSLDKVGVDPDVALAPDWDAVRAGRDPVLDAAVQALLSAP